MKTMFTSLIVCYCLLLTAQERGVAPISNASISNTQTTRAVIIGISDYRDDRIPDLNFAHKDAEAFKAYLQSPAGGELPEKNIQLLTNKKATTGQMVAAMGWLVEESQPGDKAVIYFSGHGDVERISKFQRGYLLTHDSPPNNYMAGAFPVFGLQDIISTLSEMDVQVVMVSDACRAGKLAGSNVNGTQATSAVLAQQFANEIKILSCQPEEFSLEGEQWGGGRGCFSYHLLDGLYGLADKNTDEKINLLEIERYLEDKVMTEAAPHSQIPMTVGSKSALIANVDKNYLEKILADKKNKQSAFAGIESKGIEDLILENADTNIQELYQDFLVAIKNGHLMEPEGQSANDYYEILIQEKSIEKLYGFMRRNFAAALQDESQKAIHDLFYDTEKYYAEYIHTNKKSRKNFASYLSRAGELLGPEHYMYNSIKAREFYFKSELLKDDSENENSRNNKLFTKDSIFQARLNYLNKALEYNEEAAFVHKSLASLYYSTDTTKALSHFKKAIEYAPDWAIAYIDYGLLCRDIAKYEDALSLYNRSIELDSSIMIVYQWMYWTYASMHNEEGRAATLRTIIRKLEPIIQSSNGEAFPYYYYLLGEAYRSLRIEPDRAEEVLKICLEKTNGRFKRAYILLGDVYRNSNQYKKSESAYKKALELMPDNAEVRAYLSHLYKAQKKYKEAEKYYIEAIECLPPSQISILSYSYEDLGFLYLNDLKAFSKAEVSFQKSIELKSRSVRIYYGLSLSYLYQNKMRLFEKTIQEGIKKFPENTTLFYNNACLYSIANNLEKAIEYLETAIQKGYSNYEWMQKETDLENVRKTPEFKTLMKQYFPDQFKN